MGFIFDGVRINIQVHHLEKINKILNIDWNRYCYFDLSSNTGEVALNSMSENFNIIITLNYEVLGINVRMEVVDDMQVLEMFK